jgi:hypothetical protein
MNSKDDLNLTSPFFDSNNHVGFSYYCHDISSILEQWKVQIRELPGASGASVYIRTLDIKFVSEKKDLKNFRRRIVASPSNLAQEAINLEISYFSEKSRITRVLLSCVIVNLDPGTNPVNARDHLIGI